MASALRRLPCARRSLAPPSYLSQARAASGVAVRGDAHPMPARARPRWATTAAAASATVAAPTGTFHGKVDDALAASYKKLEDSKSSILFTVADGPGSLERTLALFARHGVNMTAINSRPSKGPARSTFDFQVDFDGRPGEPAVDALLAALRTACVAVSLKDAPVVPWFPTRIADIDAFSTKTLDAGAELEADHPGFSDPVYRERRRLIVDAASAYRHGSPIPRVAYTAEEVATWGVVYRKLRSYTRLYAVEQYNSILPLMERTCGYSDTNIPQLQDISDFLRSCTGFSLRPVGGLLSARDFLNALAFRVFFSTQYLRHHTRPLYTPEPDCVHELLGHAPMFADADFADFSHEIGLASLGASDADIKRLATCYWFSVEFGLAMQDGARKAYGAGLLSSFGELEYACGGRAGASGPEFRPWEPERAAVQAYPITTYQPVYYVAESLADAKARMRAFCERMDKGFSVRFDPLTQSVTVDRAVLRGAYTVTLQT